MNPKTTLVLTTLIALAAGCGVKPPNYGQADPYDRAQVHFATKDLQDRTAVGQVQFSRDAAGLLYATVPIRSEGTTQTFYVEYRATFTDRAGQVVSQSTWMRKDLAPNVPDQVSANSTSDRAEDVQFDFRWAGMRRG